MKMFMSLYDVVCVWCDNAFAFDTCTCSPMLLGRPQRLKKLNFLKPERSDVCRRPDAKNGFRPAKILITPSVQWATSLPFSRNVRNVTLPSKPDNSARTSRESRSKMDITPPAVAAWFWVDSGAEAVPTAR